MVLCLQNGLKTSLKLKQGTSSKVVDINIKFHGLAGFTDDELNASFKRAFKNESKLRPNYGKVAGLNAQMWWANISSDRLNSVYQAYASGLL